jgi:hypothetical protein
MKKMGISDLEVDRRIIHKNDAYLGYIKNNSYKQSI